MRLKVTLGNSSQLHFLGLTTPKVTMSSVQNPLEVVSHGRRVPTTTPLSTHVPLVRCEHSRLYRLSPQEPGSRDARARRRGHARTRARDADVAMINIDAIATRMLADALRIIGKSELMTNGRVSAASPTVTLRTLIVFAFFV